MPRPRRFDEIALLDGALEIFWSRGFERTSIEDVATATGVGNGSIYAAYGSKLGLFLAVFRRYCAGRAELVERVIHDHQGDFAAAVENFLEAIVVDCTSHGDGRGCLMLNSLGELSARYPAVAEVGRETLERMNAVLEARVRAGIDAGEIALESGDAAGLGAHLVLVSQGLINLSRIGVPAGQLRSIAAASSRMSHLLSAA
ncbi:TetR/AcrR family transcriptional regulator [Microbacteriaceae bacterium VKM Ac-2854]|nr:TetR/AcrR family transcriptional regulator [Microbacteriaceae bacterium VKM Ac-2854]